MIVISAGTTTHQFQRLEKLVGELAEFSKEKIYFQYNNHSYALAKKPENVTHHLLVHNSELVTRMRAASLVIVHAGTGVIIESLKNAKVTFVIPRLAKFKEHIDNHQVEIATLFATLGYIHVIDENTKVNDILQNRNTETKLFVENRKLAIYFKERFGK